MGIGTGLICEVDSSRTTVVRGYCNCEQSC